MRGHAVGSKRTPGFQWPFLGDLWFLHPPEPTPHTPSAPPVFTFHEDRRRLSVSLEHCAKLNIFSLSVSLPSAFLPDSFRSFSPNSSLLPSLRLTADCFFFSPQIPFFSTKLSLFSWAATGKVVHVHSSLGLIATTKMWDLAT